MSVGALDDGVAIGLGKGPFPSAPRRFKGYRQIVNRLAEHLLARRAKIAARLAIGVEDPTVGIMKDEIVCRMLCQEPEALFAVSQRQFVRAAIEQKFPLAVGIDEHQLQVMLDYVAELLQQVLVDVAMGIGFRVEHADRAEGLTVGPDNRISEVGNHVEPDVWIGFPVIIVARIGDEKRVSGRYDCLAVQTGSQQMLRISRPIGVIFTAARRENLDVLVADPHNETCRHLGERCHGIDNGLPARERRGRDRRKTLIAYRRHLGGAALIFVRALGHHTQKCPINPVAGEGRGHEVLRPSVLP